MMLEMSRLPHLWSSVLAIQFWGPKPPAFPIRNRLFRHIYFSSSKERKKESCKWQLLKRDEISSFYWEQKTKMIRSDQLNIFQLRWRIGGRGGGGYNVTCCVSDYDRGHDTVILSPGSSSDSCQIPHSLPPSLPPSHHLPLSHFYFRQSELLMRLFHTWRFFYRNFCEADKRWENID